MWASIRRDSIKKELLCIDKERDPGLPIEITPGVIQFNTRPVLER